MIINENYERRWMLSFTNYNFIFKSKMLFYVVLVAWACHEQHTQAETLEKADFVTRGGMKKQPGTDGGRMKEWVTAGGPWRGVTLPKKNVLWLWWCVSMNHCLCSSPQWLAGWETAAPKGLDNQRCMSLYFVDLPIPSLCLPFIHMRFSLLLIVKCKLHYLP